MEKNVWTEPHKRKIIIVTNDANFSRLRADFYHHPGTLVYNASVKPNSESEQQLEESGSLYAGAVLLQDPYNWESYELLSSDPYDFMVRSSISKYMKICAVAQQLGIVHLSVAQENIQTKDEKRKASTNAYYFDATGDLNFQEKLSSKINLDLAFEKTKDFNVNDTRRAREILYQNHLENDPVLFQLINLREGTNKVKKLSLSTQIAKESASVLEVAIKAGDLMPIKLGGDFSKTVNDTKNTVMHICMEF